MADLRNVTQIVTRQAKNKKTHKKQNVNNKVMDLKCCWQAITFYCILAMEGIYLDYPPPSLFMSLVNIPKLWCWTYDQIIPNFRIVNLLVRTMQLCPFSQLIFEIMSEYFVVSIVSRVRCINSRYRKSDPSRILHNLWGRMKPEH